MSYRRKRDTGRPPFRLRWKRIEKQKEKSQALHRSCMQSRTSSYLWQQLESSSSNSVCRILLNRGEKSSTCCPVRNASGTTECLQTFYCCLPHQDRLISVVVQDLADAPYSCPAFQGGPSSDWCSSDTASSTTASSFLLSDWCAPIVLPAPRHLPFNCHPEMWSVARISLIQENFFLLLS